MSDRFSSDIGSDLAQVMRAHDGEAPSGADLLTALRGAPGPERNSAWSGSRRRRLIPLAAAAAVATVIAGSVWAGETLTGAGSVTTDKHGSAAPMACPARYAHPAPWVPAKPRGLPGRARLAPRRVPDSAVICGYGGMNTGPLAGWKLAGRRVLHNNLAGLAADLAWEPRKAPAQQIACTAMGGTQVNYLIGLTYPGGGRLWVSATQDPNDCVDSSNGYFTSFGVVGGLVTEAFKSGRWPSGQSAACRGGGGPGGGRLGQDRAMVPPGVISVSVCGGHGGPTLTSGYAGLVAALNALPAEPSQPGCSMAHHGPAVNYQLVFGYREGPDVVVLVHGRCVPQISNGSLQATSAATILPIIARLLR